MLWGHGASVMSPFIITLVEWGATLLSLAGFWLCIQHRASCFVVFFVADLGWFTSAWLNFHPSLLAQQIEQSPAEGRPHLARLLLDRYRVRRSME